MSSTLAILDSIRERLLAQIDRYAVELFPDRPDDYFLSSDLGAILIQYAGSKFGSLDSSDIVQQQRDVYIVLTILSRSQHDDAGALEILDQVRLAIVGFRPVHCLACSLQSEEFAGEQDGIWRYQLMLKTETWQVEQTTPTDTPKLVDVLRRNANLT